MGKQTKNVKRKSLTCATIRAVTWAAMNCSAWKVVSKLQRRIAKAVKQKRWGKVKSLQRILTRSFSARVLAVLKVTANKGSKTAGVDGTTWQTDQDKIDAITQLSHKRYKTKPLRRIYIPKNDGKRLRPLSIPTIKDRAMQQLHLLALEPVAETSSDPNSYGFRKYRSCADAIQQLFICLAKPYHAKWIFEADIKSCFDQI